MSDHPGTPPDRIPLAPPSSLTRQSFVRRHPAASAALQGGA